MAGQSIAAGKAEVAKLDFTQPEIDKLKAKLLELTEATVIVRSPERDANGKIQYIEVPNVGIQLAATVKAIEFGVGKPKQMLEVQDSPGRAAGHPGMQDLAKLLQRNPEVAAAVIQTLKTGQKMAEAIDVTPVKPEDHNALPESQSGSAPSQAS